VAALYAAMLEDSLAGLGAIEASRRVVFVAPMDDADACALVAPHVAPGWEIALQVGRDLGARLEHAFAVLFEGGPSRAIVSGSDAPMLPFELLAAARPGVVLAPCIDGGYGLISLDRPAPSLFREMTWSTPTVFAETKRRAEALGLEVHVLPLSFDVDEPPDLEQLAHELAAQPARAIRTATALAAR
jgi:glycosyltransferase A (GT-A) superfamily protein (DUF2064 family)